MDRLLKYFCVLLIASVAKVTGDCHLSLKTDFGHPSPLFLRNGTFLAPDPITGAVTLRRSETVLVACPGDKRVLLANQSTSYDVVEAHCIINNTFRVDRWIGKFKDITCSAQIWISSEEVRGGCGDGGYKLYRVGYKVKRTFHALYEACFNPGSVATLYVQHEVTPASVFAQTDGGRRPQFIEGGLFKTVNMAGLYKVKNQQERLHQMLGAQANNYISSKEFLTRGHLAARADFSLRAEQRASFHYVNTAPQWRGGNSGAWAAVEDGVRRRVNVLGRPVTVFTGTLGTSSVGGRPFHLTEDSNNNGLVPVPQYFYKLIYDPTTRQAVAFITINRSSLDSTPGQPYCSTVCEHYSWLKWKGNANACCSYEDIRQEARLPELAVTGLLVF